MIAEIRQELFKSIRLLRLFGQTNQPFAEIDRVVKYPRARRESRLQHLLCAISPDYVVRRYWEQIKNFFESA
jgi:hypothetical protein